MRRLRDCGLRVRGGSWADTTPAAGRPAADETRRGGDTTRQETAPVRSAQTTVAARRGAKGTHAPAATHPRRVALAVRGHVGTRVLSTSHHRSCCLVVCVHLGCPGIFCGPDHCRALAGADLRAHCFDHGALCLRYLLLSTTSSTGDSP